MATALFSQRSMVCTMCEAAVVLESATTQHPEAPEMLQAPTGAWVGMVSGDTAPELVVVCSTLCLHRLLSE
jgi:hypothetical protein